MKFAIEVENISKKYMIGYQRREKYLALRDELAESFRGIRQAVLNAFGKSADQFSRQEFWALRDINFQIKPGDRLGVVGRNGAGKSTLLKILSRITEPTKGQMKIRGRIASLLEVGTGFHPELTGRENIFLNGAILGMSRAEIIRKFDEIVSFSEVENFLDTPVKHYSSGMYLRLAFAIASHLEPEILIVDEILAVGDAQFQKKCFGRMQDVSRDGRTILLVSHNMQAVKQLCNRGIVLESGSLTFDGDVSGAADSYLKLRGSQLTSQSIDSVIKGLPADPAFKLLEAKIFQNNVRIEGKIDSDKSLDVFIKYQVLTRTTGLRIYIDVYDDQETLLFRTFHDGDSDTIPVMSPGTYTSVASIPKNLFSPLKYEIRVQVGISNVRHCIPPDLVCVSVEVENLSQQNRAYLGDPVRGKLNLSIGWETKNETART